MIECIKKHIQSFPMVESHNCRKDTQKMYLQSDLNLAKMYDLFSELNPKSTVKISTYRRVFKEYIFVIPQTEEGPVLYVHQVYRRHCRREGENTGKIRSALGK